MRDLKDKEIQELLEKGLHYSNPDDADFKIYDHLFDTLKKEPENGLPYNFNSKVINRIQAQQVLDIKFKFYLFSIGIVCMLFVLAYILLGLIYAPSADNLSVTVLKYKWIFIFSFSCLLLIKYADQRIRKSLI